MNNRFYQRKSLIHALLNSIIPLFILCGSGFARGKGVVDLTADSLQQFSILNPDLLDINQENRILKSWKIVSKKIVMNIKDQLEDKDWISFNKVVLDEYGIDRSVYDQAMNSIKKMIDRRSNIRNS